MKLTEEQALNVILRPVNKELIRLAADHESRLVLHTEPIQEVQSMPTPAWTDYLKFVRAIIPGDKFKRFMSLLTFPLETIDSTEFIFDELSKVFNPPDDFTRVEFSSPGYEQDFMDYVDKLHIRNYWETKGWAALRQQINSFIVVDLPKQQLTPRPEPYFFLLEIQNVHDVVINENNHIVEYIAFFDKGNKDRIILIDELAYRVYVKPENEDYTLVTTIQHSEYSESGEVVSGVGYTPVTSFYRNAIKGTRGICKRSPLTNALGKLDWLLTFKTSKRYLDMYASWPIVVHYEHECKYVDADGDRCNGAGKIQKFYKAGEITVPGEPGVYPMDGSAPPVKCYYEACPLCEMKGLMGPGTEFEVEAPKDKQQVDLMLNPVKFIEPSNDKLEWTTKETDRLDNVIKRDTCGYIDSVTKEAMNERQVTSQYESKKAILRGISEQFEHGMAFAVSTMARLRYDNLFQRSTVFLGREYFLYNTSDLIEKLAKGKQAGLPMYEISQIRETYSKTKFKDDPLQYQRTFILSQLEPYPDHSPTELKTMGVDLSDTENFYLKLEFTNFIARFEREYTNIVDFGRRVPFRSKIDIIHKKLLEYVRDKKLKLPEAGTQPNSGANEGTAR